MHKNVFPAALVLTACFLFLPLSTSFAATGAGAALGDVPVEAGPRFLILASNEEPAKAEAQKAEQGSGFKLAVTDDDEENYLELFGKRYSFSQVEEILTGLVLRAVTALIILLIGFWIARRVTQLMEGVLSSLSPSRELVGFLRGLCRYSINLVVVIMALSQLGVNVGSLLALFGAAGLAVGLAMKDTLSNFAAGVMLLVFRFFRIGDTVNVAGVEGRVDTLGIFNAVIRTESRRIIVPNSKILGNVIYIDEPDGDADKAE